MRKNCIEIEGDQRFCIPSGDFLISPLTEDCDLIMCAIDDAMPENPQPVGTLKADQYTKVHGSIRNAIYKIDTSDKFYIVWEE